MFQNPNRSAFLCGFITTLILTLITLFSFIYFDQTTVVEHGFQNSKKFEFYIISDLDKASKLKDQYLWKAILRKGIIETKNHTYSLQFKQENDTQIFYSYFSRKGRGMELSDLLLHNGKFYSFCDSSGIVYRLDLNKSKAFQKWILISGGTETRVPFKSEWSTTFKDKIYVGSIGKEWVKPDQDVPSNYYSNWVKTINVKTGLIQHLDWSSTYQLIRKTLNKTFPSYIQHEAVLWDNNLKEWLFLPRKVSDESYTEKSDETKGSNVLIFMNRRLSKVNRVVNVGPLEPTFGFSSIAKLPKTKHHYIATKVREITDENGTTIETKIAVFDEKGNILSNWLDTGDGVKYEGIEVDQK